MSKEKTKHFSENLELYQIDPDTLLNAPTVSIIESLPPLMKSQLSKNPLMDEMSLWASFNEQNLIEKKDKKEFSNFIKKCVKLSLLAIVTGTVLNRGLTKLTIRKKKFLDFSLLIKIPVRFLIYFACVKLIVFNPTLKDFTRLHYYMNHKYSNRYKRFNITGDPLEMNTLFINDPSFTPEENEAKKALYEKVKQQQTMMIMEMKEMDKMMKMQEAQNKKI
jgi:hypothetical protein